MRIAITGEMGFIAQNLIKTITASENTFVSLIGSKNICQNNTKTSEPCVYSNTVEDWASALSDKQPANQISVRLDSVLKIMPVDAGIASRTMWPTIAPSVNDGSDLVASCI